MVNYEYTNAYNRENYHKVALRIPKEKKELMMKLAKKEKRSINQLIIIAIENYYKIDLSSTKQDGE
jgi:predicted HicB family RNase H-like nuclease